ncbi:MAG: C40 family peptidase [Acidimicrobiales bacterium]
MTSLTFHFRHNAGKVALALAAALAIIASTVLPAGAGQLANERAEAQVLADKIAALGQQEAALGERYDAGVVALQLANARVRAAARALARAQAGQAHTMTLLQQDAVDAYVGGGPQLTLDASLPLDNLNDALLREELEQTFASNEADAQDGYRLAAADASTAGAQLVVARNAAAAQVAQLQQDRNQVQAAQDQLVALEARVNGQIAALVAEIQHEELVAEQQAEQARLAQERAAEEAQAQAAAAAAAQAAAQAAAEARANAAATAQAAAQQKAAALAQIAAANQARLSASLSESESASTTVPSQSSDPTPSAQSTPTAVPGVSSAASAAVAAAEARVGDPYVWGASGPDAFDCSGLVMWAYAQAGVSLPHYSGAQYDDTIHIPMSDLEPGDLVFPADPGEHVAIYVGNGEIVQAPYTGANVEVVALTGYFVLASRVG